MDLAAAHGCALVGITHYSKGTAGRDPLDRVTGSLAFGALARLVFGTAKPTEEGEPRRMVRAKSNIGPDGGGFEYQLETDRGTGAALVCSRPRVLWGSPIAGTARDLLAAVETDPEDEASVAATDEPRTGYATGSRLRGTGRRDQAGGGRNGLAWRTVQRARSEIGAQTRREGFGKGSTVLWSLTDDATIDAKTAIGAINAEQENTASMGKLGAYGAVDGAVEVEL